MPMVKNETALMGWAVLLMKWEYYPVSM